MGTGTKDLVASRIKKRTGDRLLLLAEVAAGIAVVAAIVGKTYGVAPTLFFILTALSAAFAGYVLIKMGAAWRDEALDAEGKTEDFERIRLEQEKSLLLHGIKELEADVAAGKVDQNDYAYLRQTAEARAIEIIQTLKDIDAKWMCEAEALVKKRLGSRGVPPVAWEPLASPAARAVTAGAAASSSAAWEPVASPAAGAVTARAAASSPAARGVFGAALSAVAWPLGQEPAHVLCFDDRPTAMMEKGSAVACEACGGSNDLDARYCAGCGRPKQTEARA